MANIKIRSKCGQDCLGLPDIGLGLSDIWLQVFDILHGLLHVVDVVATVPPPPPPLETKKHASQKAREPKKQPGSLWLYLALSGSLWLSLTLSGYIWLSLALS